MKKSILIILFLVSLNIIAQKNKKMFFEDFVECYYSENAKNSIFIHDSPNGKKVAELIPQTEKYCWYKFAISESKNGWLRIENILVLPGCSENELNNDFEKYKGNWVLAKDMLIDIGVDLIVVINCVSDNTNVELETESTGRKFYDEPSLNSKVVFCVSGFIKTHLIEINGTWAKLKLTQNGKEYIGWLERKYQCPYPWTNCPVYD